EPCPRACAASVFRAGGPGPRPLAPVCLGWAALERQKEKTGSRCLGVFSPASALRRAGPPAFPPMYLCSLLHARPVLALGTHLGPWRGLLSARCRCYLSRRACSLPAWSSFTWRPANLGLAEETGIKR
ncbi:unnamed protein product, partial [Amoebophrya sp. A120]